MAEPGFLYILINPSMEGLVKIGKTQRDPEHRVGELSSPTGVPTPFQLVYKAYFSDCGQAENFVHNLLQDARLTDRREFFRLSPDRAIRAVLEAERILGKKDTLVEPAQTPAEKLRSGTSHVQPKVCDELVEEAIRTLEGIGYTLQDTDRGIAMLERAANIGCLKAFRELGALYASKGGVVRQDFMKARRYFQQGIDHGDPAFWKDMSTTYFPNHPTNWYKCWRFYFTNDSFARPSTFLFGVFAKGKEIDSYISLLASLHRLNRVSNNQIGMYLDPLSPLLKRNSLLCQQQYVKYKASGAESTEVEHRYVDLASDVLMRTTSPDLRRRLDCAVVMVKASSMLRRQSESVRQGSDEHDVTEVLGMLHQLVQDGCPGSFNALATFYLRAGTSHTDRRKAAETLRAGMQADDDMCWISVARGFDGENLKLWGKYWFRYFESAHFKDISADYFHLVQKLAGVNEYLESIVSWLDQHTITEIANHVSAKSAINSDTPFHRLFAPILNQCRREKSFGYSMLFNSVYEVDDFGPHIFRVPSRDPRAVRLSLELEELVLEHMDS